MIHSFEIYRNRIAAGAAAMALMAAVPAAGQNWTQLAPAGGPPAARALASAVYDSQEHRMIVFAGENTDGKRNDIWALDLGTLTWSDLTPVAGSAPQNRRTPGSVYDPVGHRMITWSGQSFTFHNDVWAFDLTTNTWTELSPPNPLPETRYGVASIYDPVAGELVTFAGFTNMGRFDDTWRLNLAGVTWTDVSPGTSPLERCLHSASYDSQDHRMIMYGGQNAGQRDDIWAFDLATDTWSEFMPATKPAGRWHTVNEYDPVNHRVTVFGGFTAGGRANDVWVFDLTTENWSELSPSGTPPSGRDGSAAIYVPGEDRLVIFGGNSGFYENDLWSLENLSDTPTRTDTPARADVALHQNVPNPFNPSTAIAFELPAAMPVTLAVFTPAGAHVKTLVASARPSGYNSVTWDGTDSRGRRVASGVYLYKLSAGGNLLTRKLVLLK